MKRITLIFIILLMAIAFIYADGGSSAQQAEHWEKVRQLNQLAEQFKAETGFTGSVDHYVKTMRLHVYRGNFPDIQFTADADSATFRQACEQVLEKILPYSVAKPGQLSMNRISSHRGKTSTDYYQLLNGYRAESAGYIMLTYDSGPKHFIISDNTVELPEEDTNAIITPGEAEQIALRDKNDENYIISEVYNLFYSKRGIDSYYLAYLVSVSSKESPLYERFVYWIDAHTGNIRKSEESRSIESDGQ